MSHRQITDSEDRLALGLWERAAETFMELDEEVDLSQFDREVRTAEAFGFTMAA